MYWIVVLLSLLSTSLVQATTSHANLTIALVRAPPPNWPLPVYQYQCHDVMPNLNFSIDQGIVYIKQTKAAGANWIVFPELWFPGFPKGAAYNNWTDTHLSTYIANAVVHGGPEWNRLIASITEARIYVGINFAHKVGDNMYMAQALISPMGDELIFRHKLRPSGNERDMFSDGTMNQLKVITTGYGRVGMLECGEHWYPSMTFPMQAQAENFHLGPFPYMGDPGDKNYLWWESASTNTGTVGHYSNIADAYSFVPAIGYAFVTNPLAEIVASISANVSFADEPMLYYSLDITRFNTSKTYDLDSQTGWAVLQQILDRYPKYIPDVKGKLVPEKNVSIESLLAGGLNTSESHL